MSDESRPADSLRRKSEFLYRDMLGEVGALVDRLDKIAATIAAASKSGGDVAAAAVAASETATAIMRAGVEKCAEQTVKPLQTVAGEVKQAASTVSGSSVRYLGVAMVVGAAAGGVCGTLAALALIALLGR